ncbi:MAG: SAM-dependent methyltransferase, partial [Nitrospinota bacterium]|nr:SAM-dependent methyltransferase [Nitrospinota bacterium]
MPKANQIDKLRLDQLLVKKNLAASREKARGLIMAGKVKIGDEVVNRAGRFFTEDFPLQIIGDPHPYVSRGGVKLEHALQEFGLNPKGKTVADVGASTGGFTDCLLQQGA